MGVLVAIASSLPSSLFELFFLLIMFIHLLLRLSVGAVLKTCIENHEGKTLTLNAQPGSKSETK